MRSLSALFSRVAKEPPIRVLSQKLIKYGSRSTRLHALWDSSPRPHYLLGVLKAADLAAEDGIRRILALEFGVAAGNGLVVLQDVAEAVEKTTGVEVRVVGFDTGSGMPAVGYDYRDHTDWWIPQDYPMDLAALKARLKPRTSLILGNVSESVQQFLAENETPVGFIAFDLDYWSSTHAAFGVLSSAKRRMLRRTTLYFDDIDFFFNHRFGGELLAIDEFNRSTPDVRIDRWRGIKKERPFPEASWLEKMYVAHDLAAITAYRENRAARDHAS